MIQSLNICIFNLSTDSSSNKPPRILLSSRVPARCDHIATKEDMLYRLYINVSQNEIRLINIFQKQNFSTKYFLHQRVASRRPWAAPGDLSKKQ